MKEKRDKETREIWEKERNKNYKCKRKIRTNMLGRDYYWKKKKQETIELSIADQILT